MIYKEIRFLLTHSSVYGLGTVVSRLVAFVLLPLYTRYLTPKDYGVLETIEVSSGIVGIVITVGIIRGLSRFYYESEDIRERNRVVSTTYITYAALGIVSFPFLLYLSPYLSIILFQSQDYASFFQIGFASLVIGVMVDIGMMVLRLQKKPLIFVSITTSRLLLLIFFNIVFIVHFKLGVLGILYSSLIVRSLYSVIITTVILWKTKVRFSLKLSKDMLRYSLPIIPSRLANTCVKRSDKYFILLYISVADMGVYSLALKFGNVIHNLLTIPFNLAYIPRRFEIMKRDGAKETYAKIFTYYMFLVTYVGLGVSMLIPEILHVMVTPKFLGAAKIVPLVVFSMIILGSHYHFEFGILHAKKTKYLAYINVGCAFVQLGLNAFLIRLYGVWGAVVASTIALGLQAYLLFVVSNKLFPIRYEFRRIVFYMLVAGGFFCVSKALWTNGFVLNVLLKTLILCAFPIVVGLLKIVSSEEKARLKEMYTLKIKAKFLGRPAVKTT